MKCIAEKTSLEDFDEDDFESEEEIEDLRLGLGQAYEVDRGYEDGTHNPYTCYVPSFCDAREYISKMLSLGEKDELIFVD